MKRIERFAIACLAGVICLSSSVFSDDNVKVVSYYPSPRGIYKELSVYERFGRDMTSVFLAPSSSDTSTYINLGYDSTAGSTTDNSSYCAILGGSQNSTSGRYSIIGGGIENTVNGNFNMVMGGEYNSVWSSTYSFVGGGRNNTTGGTYSFLGGGYDNSIGGAHTDYSTLVGGTQNQLNGSYSTVGGGRDNTIVSNSSNPPDGTTISGGGYNLLRIGGSYNTHSTIGGGYYNTINGSYSTIGGGRENTSLVTDNDTYSTILGGYQNTIGNVCSIIGGGSRNTITPDSDDEGNYSVIGGGNYNTVRSPYSFVGGGAYNTIAGDSSTYPGDSRCNAIAGGTHNKIERDNRYCFIGGGYANTIEAEEEDGNYCSVVCGGQDNRIASDETSPPPECGYAFIGGGESNRIRCNAKYSAIAGGKQNTIKGYVYNVSYGFIAGGESNYISEDSACASILGGSNNLVEDGAYATSGDYACVVGGYMNTASAPYSVAMGRKAIANRVASFVWNSGGSYASSETEYSFNVYCHGAYYKAIELSGEHPIPELPNTFGDRADWAKHTSMFEDLAEFIPVGEKDISDGDLVSVKYPGRLGKTTEPYDSNLIGLVSSRRTMLMSMGSALGDEENSRFIALAGIVYCNVCDEGGPITLGDPITSSSIPGVGMKANKACKIVGYAMESFNKEKGEVAIFCNSCYYIPPEKYLDLKSRLEKIEEQLVV